MSSPAGQHWLIATLLVAVGLAALWLVHAYNISADLTANKRHELTPETVKAARALQGPVDLIAVLGPNPAERKALTELVTRYQQHNPLITLRFLNPETDPAGARALQAAAGGELIVRGMEREQRLRNVSERNLTGALRQLNRDGDRRLAFITGHDERAPGGNQPGDWLAVTERLRRIGLVAEERSLVSDPRLGDEADVIVIADPRRAYFPGEIAILLEYISLGGNLLWLIETQVRSPAGPGLDALALELGIDTLPGVVIDTASQRANAGSPTFVIINQFSNHPVNAVLNSPVLLPQATALSITPLPGQSLLPLLQTPESSWTETGELEGAVGFDEDTDESRGPLALGITIERQLPTRTQRIAIIGDADFASTRFAGNGANLAFAESLFLWLSGDADDMEFVTRAAPDSQLQLTTTHIIVLSAVLLAVIPLLLLLVACLLFWRKRRQG